ncbi:hypothetical protein T07_15283 [Trichinella nelsoni]|uniref:Uncharacterized protein n=1 Tax=Trichinella nelsoni TaxID=6336 RepID=A0A0V0SLI9_9BILA|nr:hypothetical protein T07_15283 [Trichinella nelsoni]
MLTILTGFIISNIIVIKLRITSPNIYLVHRHPQGLALIRFKSGKSESLQFTAAKHLLNMQHRQMVEQFFTLSNLLKN